MGVGRGDLGPLDFENFGKKGCFLSFEWEKNKFHHFWPLLEKFGKNPLEAPPWKKSFRRRSFTSKNILLHVIKEKSLFSEQKLFIVKGNRSPTKRKICHSNCGIITGRAVTLSIAQRQYHFVSKQSAALC